jgi:hypothetical protein
MTVKAKKGRSLKMNEKTMRIVISLFFLFVFKSTADGAVQTLGGAESEGSLRISIYDNGDMAVHRYTSGFWQQQWFGGNSKSTLFYMDGTDYAVEGSYYNGAWFSSEATPLTTVSNTSTEDTAELILERSGIVRIRQTLYYPPAAAYFTLRWEVTNLSDATVHDLRFFWGGIPISREATTAPVSGSPKIIRLAFKK